MNWLSRRRQCGEVMPPAIDVSPRCNLPAGPHPFHRAVVGSWVWRWSTGPDGRLTHVVCESLSSS